MTAFQLHVIMRKSLIKANFLDVLIMAGRWHISEACDLNLLFVTRIFLKYPFMQERGYIWGFVSSAFLRNSVVGHESVTIYLLSFLYFLINSGTDSPMTQSLVVNMKFKFQLWRVFSVGQGPPSYISYFEVLVHLQIHPNKCATNISRKCDKLIWSFYIYILCVWVRVYICIYTHTKFQICHF